jgi:hypothetical protein
LSVDGIYVVDHLARKIRISKWESTSYTKGTSDVRADSITGRDLQTTHECLSVWRCSNSKDDAAEIALALATTFSTIEGVHIVLLDRRSLEDLGFAFNDVRGDTRVEDLNERHTDIVDLDIFKIILLAICITIKVRADDCYQFTKREVEGLLRKAIGSGRLDPTRLPRDIQRQLQLK